MLERTEQNGIVTLRMAHGKANALDLEFMQALSANLLELAEMDDVHAIILTGTGSIFSAGVDLFRIVESDVDYTREFLTALDRATLELFTLPKPVVAAVNGHAIAGGCVLTEACDYRLMVNGKGRIGAPELLVGVPFPPTILEVLRFAIPNQHLSPLIYSGLTMLAEDAAQRGIVDEITDAETLEARALDVAKMLAALPIEAFRLTKRQLRNEAVRKARRYAGEFDSAAVELWTSDATRAGIRAYLEKTIKR
jgi:enoyl-CoA hydratase